MQCVPAISRVSYFLRADQSKSSAKDFSLIARNEGKQALCGVCRRSADTSFCVRGSEIRLKAP